MMKRLLHLSNRLYLPVLIIIFLGVGFYWFQVRPAIIKHNCSWVEMHTDAIQAKAGMTEEELKAKGMIKTCLPAPIQTPGIIGRIDFDNKYSPFCEMNNREIIDKYKSQKYVPAKDWYEKASPQQYQFCLHDNGL